MRFNNYDGNSMGPIVLRSVIPSELKLCYAERSMIEKIQHFGIQNFDQMFSAFDCGLEFDTTQQKPSLD